MLTPSRNPTTGDIDAAVDLYWLPLGAGASFVHLNGRVYEAVVAARERRSPLDLYHSALQIHTPQGPFTIELTPIPDGNGAARGVVAEGPVGSRRLARFRLFRYELRCWQGGAIPDIDQAVDSPQRLTLDPVLVRRVLDLLPAVPTPVWGRDELGAGEMWNSNSVISWLVTRSGLPMELAHAPSRGRAPGWDAGVILAQRQGGGGLIRPTGGAVSVPWMTERSEVDARLQRP
ncbi:MAG TPA: hypothetical protein VMM13_03750 [Euzebya sp.]|nr:hypothetical protein [Euzebya sp.]